MNRKATPLTYLNEIVVMSSRHGGELAVAIGVSVLVGLTALVTRALLHFQPLNGWRVLYVLIPLIGMVLMFMATVAAWRLHQKQTVALATTRTLLDLNADDRADLERDLRTRFRRREADTELRHTARIDRLSGEITALQTLHAASPTTGKAG
ncbi:MAG TPA: hypothetical protein VGQ36_08930 [Thermoanaerobaculia bacterium]|jgi:hypothetical protein|nr:hypothetical protein [Thermoanaerobaculia bacterium]